MILVRTCYRVAVLMVFTVLLVSVASAGVFEVFTQSEWNAGTFNGTSADRDAHSGVLGIGYEDGEPEDDLLAYWRFDAGVSADGGTVLDYSGNDIRGETVSMEDTGVDGVWSGRAFAFDGEDSFVDFGDHGENQLFDTGSGAITFWVNAEDAGRNQMVFIFEHGADDGRAFLVIRLIDDGGDADIEVVARDDDDSVFDEVTTTDTPVDYGQWHHVVVQSDGSDLEVYVDGDEENLDDNTDHWLDIGFPADVRFMIGEHAGFADGEESWFDGRIDEFQIHDSPLSDDEITEHYRWGPTFQGDYTSSMIDPEGEVEWEDLTVDMTTDTADTDAWAEVTVFDDQQAEVDSQVISLDAGEQTYPLDLVEGEQAQVSFNGTSTEEEDSWEIDWFEVEFDAPNFCTSNNPIEYDIKSRSDWNEGTFDGLSADRDDHSGDLGLGYLDDPFQDGSIAGYWRLDRTDGDVHDYSGNDNHGTENGPTRGVDGVFGTDAFSFDGSSDYVDLGDPSELDFSGDPEHSISAWVKWDGSGSGSRDILHFGDWDIVLSLDESEDIDDYITYTVDGGVSSDFSTISEDRWYHLVGTYDGNTIRLYMDGEIVDQTSHSTSIGDYDGPVVVGARSDGGARYWPGEIDEVQVYDQSLDEEDVEALYLDGHIDDEFEGTYTTRMIPEEEGAYRWNEMELSLSDPGFTDAEAEFRALSEEGELVGRDTHNLGANDFVYEVDVPDSARAEIVFTFTSESHQTYPDELRTPTVNSIDIDYEKVGAPDSGDWIISEDCEIPERETAPENLYVEDGAVVNVLDGASLGLDFHNFYLMIRENAGILIRDGGDLLQRLKVFLTVETEDVTDTHVESATLEGDVTEMENADTVDSWFQYGEDDLGQTTDSTTLTDEGTYDATITDLAEDTEYQYRAVAEADDGTMDYGDIKSFKTLIALAVETGDATDIGENSATLNGEVTHMNDTDTVDAWFEYGEDSFDQESSNSTRSSPGSYSDTVSGLDPATEYQYRAVALTEDGTRREGETATFATESDADGAHLADGWTHYWAMDEDSGTTVADHGDNALHGTIEDATWVSESDFETGVGLDFDDGTSDGVDVGDDTSIDFTDSFSYYAEVMIGTTDDHQVMVEKSGVLGIPESQYGLSLSSGDSLIGDVETEEGRENAFDTFPGTHGDDGGLNRIVAVHDFDDSEVTLYVNGEEFASDTLVGDNPQTEDNPLVFGYSAGADAYGHDGTIGEVAMWDRALDDGEATDLTDTS